MTFHPFDVTVPHMVYAFLGGFIVIFGMFSLFIKERAYIGEAVIATVFGIIIGPEALDLISPTEWASGDVETVNEITLEVTRVIIAIGVFAIGVELPKAYMKRHWKSMAYLLGPCMVYGWLVSGLLIWGLIPHMEFLTALAIAACVTPTDPILAQAVVGGKFADKHVPAHIRHMLVAESGCNDGAAFPFLYLALYLILDKNDGYAVGQWFYITWVYEVLLGIIIGSVIGFAARKTMKFSERRGLIDRQSFVAQYVSLAVLTIGCTTLLGSDDLLAAFACGTAFAWDGFFNKATEDSMFSNVIDLLFNVAGFIYIGAIIPFSAFRDTSISLTPWRLVVLAICILLLRRLPVILALYRWIPDIQTLREAAFVGWFGPMGVGAIFIATLARTHLPTTEGEPQDQVQLLSSTIQPIVAFLVLCSVLCHGLSIPFFSLTRRVHSITHTWSRTSFDRGEEPAWTSHARRIRPGDVIQINRDDDHEGEDEGGDDGAEDRGGGMNEKALNHSSSTDSSATASGSTSGIASEIDIEKNGQENYEMRQRQNNQSGGSRDPVDVENAVIVDQLRRASGDGVYSCPEEEGRECRTPPILAEYREGPHLVIEKKHDDEDEVEVEVIKNYYREDKDAEKSTFSHPRPLHNNELDKIWSHIPHSAHKAVSHVEGGGSDPIDELGMGMMKKKDLDEMAAEEKEREEDNVKREEALEEGKKEDEERDPTEGSSSGNNNNNNNQSRQRSSSKSKRVESSRRSSTSRSPITPYDYARQSRVASPQQSHQDRDDTIGEEDAAPDDGDDNYEDIDDDQPVPVPRPVQRRQNSYRPPTILISRPAAAAAAAGRRRMPLRNTVRSNSKPAAGYQRPEVGSRPRDAEEGMAGHFDGDNEGANERQGREQGRYLSPAGPSGSATPYSTTNLVPSRERSPSPPRMTSLRFAPNVAESSDTVPGPSRTSLTSTYTPHRRTPSGSAIESPLALHRTTSAHSIGDGASRSLRFAPDVSESSDTAPGPTYYKRPASGGNPGLSMFRSQSLVSDDDGEGGEGSDGRKKGGGASGGNIFARIGSWGGLGGSGK